MNGGGLKAAVVPIGELNELAPKVGLPSDAPLLGSTLCCRVSPEVARAVEKQAKDAYSTEVAGLLLGEVYEQDGAWLVDVTNHLPARYTSASRCHVTFTARTWVDLIARRDEARVPVVGWYHSHPGHGAFLSGMDQALHEAFFGGARWYLALVIDPSSGETGVFTAGGRTVLSCREGEKVEP